MLFVLALVDLIRLYRERLGRGLSRLVAVLVAALVVVATGPRTVRWVRGDLVERDFYSALARDIRPGDRIAFLTIWGHNAFPLVQYAHARWAMPTPSLWWLQYVSDYGGDSEDTEEGAKISDGVRFLTSAVVDSLVKAPPDVIIVDGGRTPAGMKRPFDFVESLSVNPGLQRVLAGYGRVATYRSCVVLRRGAADRVAPPSPTAQPCVARSY